MCVESSQLATIVFVADPKDVRKLDGSNFSKTFVITYQDIITSAENNGRKLDSAT